MSATKQAPEWLAIALSETQAIVWQMSETQVRQRSIASIEDKDPLNLLSDLLNRHAQARPADKQLPVFVSGSALAPVADVPTKAAEQPCGSLVIDGWQVHLLPGVQQAAPVALMHGAETQITGFLALNPKWDGVICLPGETTHWAQISADEIVSFQSFVTTQLFFARGYGAANSWSLSALREATDDTMSKPERLAARLGELAAHAQRDSKDATDLNGLLWGYLIGAELVAARPYWLGQNLALIGPDDLTAPYAAALEAQGLPVTRAETAPMVLAGLVQAWRRHFAPATAS